MNVRAPLAAFAILVVAACTTIPADSPTPQPTAPPTEIPTLTAAPTPTVEPTGIPTLAPTLAPTPPLIATWTGPDLIVPGAFRETAILVDAAGIAHIAAAGSGADKGIWYITNASGAWTSEQLSTPPVVEGLEGEEYDGEPAIAMDIDGSIWIAFTRYSCWECAPGASDALLYASNTSGAWSEPVQLAGAETHDSSLVVRDASIYLAYHEGMVPGRRTYPVWYGTDAGGELTLTRISRDANFPRMLLDPSGSASVLFSDNHIRFVQQTADGTFGEVESLPGSGRGFFLDLAMDPVTGTTWAGWAQFSADDHIETWVASRGPDGWTDPTLAIRDGELTGLGVNNGLVHVTAVQTLEDWGPLLYASNVGGELATSQLDANGGQYSALAVDGIGRPHVVFGIDADAGLGGLWYAIGPNV